MTTALLAVPLLPATLFLHLQGVWGAGAGGGGGKVEGRWGVGVAGDPCAPL